MELNNETIIRNISTDQSEILRNISLLYNNGEAFECDITASQLKFYDNVKGQKYTISKPRLLYDVYPQLPEIKQIIPFKPLPLEDNSLQSVVVDLPFVINPKTCKSYVEKLDDGKTSKIPARFSCWYPRMEAYSNMYWWIKECARVLKKDGICIYKMQSVISGSVYERFIDFAKTCGEEFGLYIEDEFILEAKSRMICQSKMKKQYHSRKFTSTFLVFKKNNRLADKTSTMKLLQICKETVHEGMEFELK